MEKDASSSPRESEERLKQRTALDEVERLVAERTSERDELRRQLAAAEEAERRRLGRELHDQLGQQLTALALGLAQIRRLTESGRSIQPQLTRLEELAGAITRDVRYLALELRPPELDDLGLESAIESYVAQWSARCGIAAEVVKGHSADGPIAAEVGSALYRILQEALTNVAKHARAEQVSVILERADGAMQLIIEDDGRGFDLEASIPRVRGERRLGLAGMRERAALVGGTVTVESTAEGGGTSVYVRLPIAPPVGSGAERAG